ncbi:lysylphosphatidylglycerol synthase transmembrane domain-containing protein [Flammeovirgaceae bacterium SG7u.111]|nr:lysylphosphatidylglycerol synthase transmembrane domain-containing protein [Flammeovirgaceae bacterium SG7u.132]WPO37116.1 lysylphosphatidylglycerol synthase transmembrane domain-containing protein [Flammeovirgaceae bacterium SG7u.111]
MKKKLISTFKYVSSLSLGALLIWYLYKDQSTSEIGKMLTELNLFWVVMSLLASIAAHYTRAWRWTVAMKPIGYDVSSINAFLAVMSGYFANLFVPRLGEFMRCGLLNKTDSVAVNKAFGTVVTERVVDLIMLATMAIALFLVEYEMVGSFVLDNISSHPTGLMEKALLFLSVGIMGILILFALYKFRSRLRQNRLYAKAYDFLMGLKEGLLSIKDLNPKQRIAYIFSTFAIWVCYFLMTYFLFFALPETSSLGLYCAFNLLVLGSVGMAIPTPGGTGSFHLFAIFTLTLFGVDELTGKNFALLSHGLSTLILLVGGGISLIISFFITNRKKKQEKVTIEKLNRKLIEKE